MTWDICDSSRRKSKFSIHAKRLWLPSPVTAFQTAVNPVYGSPPEILSSERIPGAATAHRDGPTRILGSPSYAGSNDRNPQDLSSARSWRRGHGPPTVRRWCGRARLRRKEPLMGCRLRGSRSPGQSVVGRGVAGKKHVLKTELAEIADPHRIQDAVQVIALVLDHTGVEIRDGPVDAAPVCVEPCVAQLPEPRHQPPHPRDGEAAFPPVLQFVGKRFEHRDSPERYRGSPRRQGYRALRNPPKITTRSPTAICGAAMPAPCIARMVSSRSVTSACSSGVSKVSPRAPETGVADPPCGSLHELAWCSTRRSKMPRTRAMAS
jgi:hypothetical protein